MNILFYSVNSNYVGSVVGGAEISLRLIAEKFVQIKQTAIYVTHQPSRLPKLRTEKINGVKVYFISVYKTPKFITKFIPKIVDNFVRWQTQWLLKKIIIKENIDIVHTYNEYPNTYDLIKIKNKYKKNFKVVIRIGGFGWKRLAEAKPYLNKKIEWTFNNVDLINYVSEETKNAFKKETEKLSLKIKPLNEFVLDIGINGNLISSPQKHTDNIYKFLMAARFEYPKRQDLIVEAVAQLKKYKIEIHFAGTGPKEIEIKKLAKDLGVTDKIIFHGYVKQNELFGLLKESHIFCIATEYEGVPKSMLEAMGLGIPVLASNVSPLNKYIIDGQNGFVIDNTVSDWKNKIESLLKNEVDANLVSKNSIDYVRKYFNSDNNIYRYKTEFEQLLN